MLHPAEQYDWPKLIAFDNVWKAVQRVQGNRAFTFPHVKEKYWRRFGYYQ
jgi:hypothetical protein